MHEAILCVDDEAIILLSLKQDLYLKYGDRFIYETAINAEKASAVIEDLENDGVRIVLIISDWLMPGMKGDAFVEQTCRKHPEIKAIMITGNADAESISRVEQIPSVLGVLQKPWDPKDLFSLIAEAFET